MPSTGEPCQAFQAGRAHPIFLDLQAFTIVAPGTKPEIWAYMPANDLPRFKLGTKLQVSLPGFEKPFHNLWRYYLMYCEGGFRGGVIDVAQVTMGKR